MALKEGSAPGVKTSSTKGRAEDLDSALPVSIPQAKLVEQGRRLAAGQAPALAKPKGG